MSNLSLENIRKEYDSVPVVDNLNLEVRAGEVLILLGPSGCGKTTTLRMVAGFIAPTEGEIRIGNQIVTNLPARKRNIGMVFQDYSLFPNMTVAENIAFGLRQRGKEKSEIAGRVSHFLDLIRLPQHGDRLPSQLSGGQQQRVALARALAYSPRVLLMDEPFGSLDLKLREAMQGEFHRIQQELRITTVLVTHDQEEAMALGDRIVLMDNGKVQQLGTPEELYRQPKSAFVANFIGKTNLLKGNLTAIDRSFGTVHLANGSVMTGCLQNAGAIGDDVAVAVRPEALMLAEAANSTLNQLRGTITLKRFLGTVNQYTVTLSDGTDVVCSTPASQPRPTCKDVVLACDQADVLIFPAPDPAKVISAARP